MPQLGQGLHDELQQIPRKIICHMIANIHRRGLHALMLLGHVYIHSLMFYFILLKF